MFEKKPVEVGEFRGDNIELEENSFIAGSTNNHRECVDNSKLDKPPAKGYIFQGVCVVSQKQCSRTVRHVCIIGGCGQYHKRHVIKLSLERG